MAVTQLNNTTNVKFIPTIIAQKALGRLPAYLNLAKTVSKDFEWSPTTVGQTIKIPKRAATVASAKTAGEEVTRQNPTATDVSVTLDQHWEHTITIDDVTRVLQNQNVQDGYADDGAIALAEKVEQKLAQLHTSITNTVTFDQSSATTMEDSFLLCRQRMIENKVPMMEAKYAYVTPKVMRKLLQIDRFTRADAYGKSGIIAEGALGRIGGIDVFESQMVESSGSPVTYHNLVYTRNSMVLAFRPLPIIPSGMGAQQTVVQNESIGLGLRVTSAYDPKLLEMQITLDILFGVALIDDRRIIELESN